MTKILDIDYYSASKSEFLKIIELLSSQGFNGYIVTPNIDHIVRIKKSQNLNSYYSASAFCVNDSKVLSGLVKLIFNLDLPTITGSDLTEDLFSSELLYGKRIGIIGCSDYQVAILKNHYPFLNLQYHINPSMGFYENEKEMLEIVSAARGYELDFLFIAVGSPQQEMLAHRLNSVSNHGITFCVGASIDYLTGKEIRAPKFIQAMYLEWLFRFAQSPIKRFKRYFINCPQIIYYLLKERFSIKKL